jgi:hypothetical protein
MRLLCDSSIRFYLPYTWQPTNKPAEVNSAGWEEARVQLDP